MGLSKRTGTPGRFRYPLFPPPPLLGGGIRGALPDGSPARQRSEPEYSVTGSLLCSASGDKRGPRAQTEIILVLDWRPFFCPMLRSKFIDDEAEEEEPESDICSDEEIDTAAATEEDEQFIVEVVTRRFGLQPDRVENLAGRTGNSSSLVVEPYKGLRQQCSGGYNSDCSAPRTRITAESGGTVGSISSGDFKSPLVIGTRLEGKISTSRGKCRKVVPKASRESVVSTPVSERVLKSLDTAKVSDVGTASVQSQSDEVRVLPQTEEVSMVTSP